LIAIGRFSADGEIVALQASGLGPFQLLRPMAMHGFPAMGLSLAICVFVHPWASYELHAYQARIVTARNVTSEIQPRVFFDALPGSVLFVDAMPAGKTG